MKEECMENFIGTVGQKHLKGKQNPFMAINLFDSFTLRSPTSNGKETRHI
jgi:hypothetical protein